MISRLDINIAEEFCEREIVEIRRRLKDLPACRICARKMNGHYRFFVRSRDCDGIAHEKYVPSGEADFIRSCCEEKYLRKLLPVLEKELSALRAFEKNYDPYAKYEVWDRLPDAYKQYAEKRFADKKEICSDWEYAEFESNPYPISGGAQYVTKKGETVRSRIELIAANMLYDYGIPYRYECGLELASGCVYPDFTIMHPDTLELYYMEIFGLMDNPEYERAAFSKIAKYAASDKYSHLIMVFDHKNAPIYSSNIESILVNTFLQR